MNDDYQSPYTPVQRIVIIVSCVLGFALDLYDVLIMPYLMPSIEHSLNISLSEVASLTTVTLIGSVLGGGLFGWIGDRLGRKSALQLTLLVFALASLGSAFAPNVYVLLVLRFILGIGLGGEWGAGMVLFNEAWNPKRRGLGTSVIQGAATIAAACASVVGLWAIGSFSLQWGWRIGLLTGGVPVVLAFFVRFWMPESQAWQQYDRQRRVEIVANRSNTFKLMFQGRQRFITIAAAIWLTAYMFCYYAVVVFIPSFMLRVLGTAPDVVRTSTVIAAFAGCLCYVAMGWLNDRWGRRFGALGPGVFWLIAMGLLYFAYDKRYAGSFTAWPVFWLPIMFAMGSTALGVVGTWLSELYPIEIRATAVSTLYMFGRAAGSVSPMLVPLAAAHWDGQLAHGMLIALPAALIFFVLSCFLPETHRRRSGVDLSKVSAVEPANTGDDKLMENGQRYRIGH